MFAQDLVMKLGFKFIKQDSEERITSDQGIKRDFLKEMGSAPCCEGGIGYQQTEEWVQPEQRHRSGKSQERV